MCYNTLMTKSAYAQTISDRNEKAGNFAQEWVSSNVINVPGLDDVPRGVERLASQMTADAREQGIRGGDIARSVGDIDDFLTAEYEKKKPAASAAGFST